MRIMYFIVTMVGVVLEDYNATSDWPLACAHLRDAQVRFPLAGCRILQLPCGMF